MQGLNLVQLEDEHFRLGSLQCHYADMYDESVNTLSAGMCVGLQVNVCQIKCYYVSYT